MRLKTSKSRVSKPSPKRAKRASSKEYNENQLSVFARGFSKKLRPGDRVFLEGPLGAGKTTFSKAILKSLGVTGQAAGSPTFAIAHDYKVSKREIIHIDFYRLKSPSEIEDAGIASYFWERNAIIISEWVSLFPDFLNAVIKTCTRSQMWQIELSMGSKPTLRKIKVTRI